MPLSYHLQRWVFHTLRVQTAANFLYSPSPSIWMLRKQARTSQNEPLTPFLHFLSNQTTPIKTMEVEVKLRLPGSASHQKLSSLLSPFHTKTLIQENVFFDGSNCELSSNLAVLRVRFSNLNDSNTNTNPQSVLSLKAKPIISDGISRVEEVEEPLDPILARACIAEPWRLLSVDSSSIIRRVKEDFRLGDRDKGLVCLGGFRNVRAVYDWQGLKLEVDETNYDFGTCYEVECESSDPERDKKLIERLLEENGIDFSYSESSKFAIFLSRKLPS